MNYFYRFTLLLTLLFSVGCNQLKKDLPVSIRNKEKTTDFILISPQQEINIEVRTVNTGGQFGLIGAIIEAEVNKQKAKNANKSISDIRNTLIDTNVDLKFNKLMKQNLQSVSWINLNSTQTIKEAKATEALNKVLRETKSDLAMTTHYTYLLGADFQTLTAELHVNLFPIRDDLKKLVEKPDAKSESSIKNSIYRNVISTQVPLKTGVTEKQAAIASWLKDDGKLIKAALDEVLMLACETLVYDLNKPTTDNKDLKSKKFKRRHGIFEYGKVENESKGRYLIRAKDGSLFSKIELLK